MTRRTLTASTTLDAYDQMVDVDATDGAVTITLPPQGQAIRVRKIDTSANAVTVEPSSGQSLSGRTTLSEHGDMAAYEYDGPAATWNAVLEGAAFPLPALPATPRTITFTGTYNGNAVDLTATFD